MNTHYKIQPGLLKHSAVALGFFDGVHPGHQVVIAQAKEEARRLQATPALVTFRDHPRNLTKGQAPKLLTLLPQRVELFEELGMEVALVLSFNKELCRMTASEYVQTVLVDCLGVKSVSVGKNHHFGRNREGNPELLQNLGQQLGFSVHVAPLLLFDGLEVSSSRIREALQTGDVGLAKRLLARPYAVYGRIVHGSQVGNQIGFPTANVEFSERQMLPQCGVYAGMARFPDRSRIGCVINLGYRPTVAADPRLTLEAHLINFDKNLYGSSISLEFWERLRSEQKFASVADLQSQIQLDIIHAGQFLPLNNQACSVRSPDHKLLA